MWRATWLALALASVGWAATATCVCQTPASSSCPPDLNKDATVNAQASARAHGHCEASLTYRMVKDLFLLLAAWGTPGADLNADGTTNAADLFVLLAAWGSACVVVPAACALDEEQALWLDAHNRVRRAISPTFPLLRWNATLANSAWSVVSACPASPGHSVTTNGESLAAWFGSSYGANDYQAPGMPGRLQSLGSAGRVAGERSTFQALAGLGCTGSVASPFSSVLGWSTFPTQFSMCAATLSPVSEASAYGACADTCSLTGNSCGHYRQLVNQATRSVGCAAYYCSARSYWWAVCQYDQIVFSNVAPVNATFCAGVPAAYTFEGFNVDLRGAPFWTNSAWVSTPCP